MAILDVEKAVRKVLDDASIGASVYPHTAPEGASRPYVIYSRISSVHHHHLTAASGLNQVRIQFDIYGDSYSSVKSTAENVRQALDGYSGTVTIDTDSVTIQSAILDSDMDGFEISEKGFDEPKFRVIHDYLVMYGESVPTF